jgi:pSer/pThr/pTyr-binding forkhead associated (FHA) protein
VALELHVRFLTGATRDEERTFRDFPLKIGRSDECELRFDPDEETNVSGLHAEVCIVDGNFTVVDLNSRNGLFLDGERVKGCRTLPPRSTLTVGKDGPRLEVFARSGTRGFSFADARRKSEGVPADRRPLVSTDDSFQAYTSAEPKTLAPRRKQGGDGLGVLWAIVILLAALLLVGVIVSFVT